MSSITCHKCHGTGYIDGFAHIRNGICFQCNGKGTLPEAKKRNVSYSRSFVFQFLQKGFFPEDQSSMIPIKCIAQKGHATAEQWILSCGTDFVIGQPICRSTTWYTIPAESFGEFITHYNKLYRKENPIAL